MKICKTISEFKNWRNSNIHENIGYIPTMGALHKGHLSLVASSKLHCDKTVVSIFVNELQFSPDEDFEKYPRTLEQDLKKLENHKVDVVFIPETSEIYKSDFSILINELDLSQKLEGASRPGFFSGVTTVVSKLFNIIEPSYAFFGEKDIQQLIIIKKLVLDLNFNIQVVGCETIREASGLAMSSRNQYLSDQDKKDASILYETLQLGQNLLKKNETVGETKLQLKSKLQNNKKIKIDYLSIANSTTLEELRDNVKLKNEKVIISAAIFFNDVRLIDNIII
ncbi:MAG: pantoate--beta-alanine ligase [bacterium TMED6]|nr:MAG: pantoate--beta-alanine ligase [bacterium TMED6]